VIKQASVATAGYLALAFGLALINLLGINLDLAEPDAAIYAEVAREIHASGDWLSLAFRGEPFLDKPHFPFWLSAASFALFGVESFAYRLPALLFSLLGVVYTYMLAKRLYNHRVGIAAGLILLGSAHFVVSNTDVRAEAYLAGLTVFALYHLIAYLQGRAWRDLLLACLGAACLLMTKGLFTLMPLFFGVLGGVILTRDWHRLFDWRWAVGIAVTLLLTTPVMLAYALQFDFQPEQEVRVGAWGEVTGVSGIRFFWWDSQFGRFFNSGPIQGEGEPWFYLHTLLWAFFPWALLWFAAAFSWFRNLNLGNRVEPYCLPACLPVLVIFSASQFQLPHYLNPLFPLFAITVAAWLYSASETWLARLGWAQLFAYAPPLLAPPLFWWLSKTPEAWSLAAFGACILALVLVYAVGGKRWRLLGGGLAVACLVNLFILGEALPWLTGYQAGSRIAHFVKQEKLAQKLIMVYGLKTEALDFYLDRVVPRIASLDALAERPDALLVTKSSGLAELEQTGTAFTQIAQFDDYAITRFKWEFFNRKRRHEVVSPTYLVAIHPGH